MNAVTLDLQQLLTAILIAAIVGAAEMLRRSIGRLSAAIDRVPEQLAEINGRIALVKNAQELHDQEDERRFADIGRRVDRLYPLWMRGRRPGEESES